MDLRQCKSCSHHICVMGNVVLCGYTIDRTERPIIKEGGVEVVRGCPKENKE